MISAANVWEVQQAPAGIDQEPACHFLLQSPTQCLRVYTQTVRRFFRRVSRDEIRCTCMQMYSCARRYTAVQGGTEIFSAPLCTSTPPCPTNNTPPAPPPRHARPHAAALRRRCGRATLLCLYCQRAHPLRILYCLLYCPLSSSQLSQHPLQGGGEATLAAQAGPCGHGVHADPCAHAPMHPCLQRL